MCLLFPTCQSLRHALAGVYGLAVVHPSISYHSETPSSSFVLPRNELDFPIGIGKDIIDVELKMEWCQDEVEDTQVETAQPDSPLSGVETVVASLAGGVEVGQAVES